MCSCRRKRNSVHGRWWATSASSQWFMVVVGFVLWLLSASLLRLLRRSIFQYWAAFPWRPWRPVSGPDTPRRLHPVRSGKPGRKRPGPILTRYDRQKGGVPQRCRVYVHSAYQDSQLHIIRVSSRSTDIESETSRIPTTVTRLPGVGSERGSRSHQHHLSDILASNIFGRDISNTRGTRGGPFEYTCDSCPTQQREKTSEYCKTSFSIPGQCFLELLLPDSDVLDTGDDIHRVDTQAE
jgi:hypothetical protein